MSRKQTPRTTRTTPTTAVQSPRDRAAVRTTRGFAAFVAVAVAVVVTAMAPFVAATVGGVAAVAAGTVVAVRRRPDRRTGPPDDEGPTRSTAHPTAD